MLFIRRNGVSSSLFIYQKKWGKLLLMLFIRKNGISSSWFIYQRKWGKPFLYNVISNCWWMEKIFKTRLFIGWMSLTVYLWNKNWFIFVFWPLACLMNVNLERRFTLSFIGVWTYIRYGSYLFGIYSIFLF